tara:strand:+ start:3515 stop:4051 length:537 start_codon:yes stop_codon:yes gene_type:complete
MVFKAKMIRILDIIISSLSIIILMPIFIIFFFLGWLKFRSPIFVQKRLGINLKVFKIFKFKTMITNSYQASHFIKKKDIPKYGEFLRRTKIDELPQLFNVLKGDMSLVGPRPCLLNQKKLITERKKRNIFTIKPGITGLAQVRGVDMSTPKRLSKIDTEMLKINIFDYFKYILMTLKK